jgi:hypothetical protein
MSIMGRLGNRALSAASLLLSLILIPLQQGDCLAQETGTRGQNDDAARQARVGRLFQDIEKFKAQGNYDQIVWAAEDILKITQIPDKQGNRDAASASRAWREMEAAHQSIEAQIDGMLRGFESNQLLRIKSALDAFDQRAERPEIRPTFEMNEESDLINGTLPVFENLERCLAQYPAIVLCRPGTGNERGPQKEIESATVQARSAFDAACRASSADEARKSTAEVERARAIIGGFREKVTAWSSRGVTGSQIECGNGNFDLKDLQVAPPEFDRKAAGYESRLGQIKQAQDAMKAELDRVLAGAQSDFEEMRRTWQSREVAALLDAHRQVEKHIKPSGNQGKWAKWSQGLLLEGQAEIARIQNRVKYMAGGNAQDYLRRIGQMRQKIEQMKAAKQRMQTQMACADRIAALYTARMDEAEQLTQYSSQCFRVAEAKEAAERAEAEQRIAMLEKGAPAPRQPDVPQPPAQAAPQPTVQTAPQPPVQAAPQPMAHAAAQTTDQVVSAPSAQSKPDNLNADVEESATPQAKTSEYPTVRKAESGSAVQTDPVPRPVESVPSQAQALGRVEDNDSMPQGTNPISAASQPSGVDVTPAKTEAAEAIPENNSPAAPAVYDPSPTGPQSSVSQTTAQAQGQTATGKIDRPGGEVPAQTAQTAPAVPPPSPPQQSQKAPDQISPRTDGYYRTSKPTGKLFYLRFINNGVARAAYYFPLAGSNGTVKLNDVMPDGRFDIVDKTGTSLLAAAKFMGYQGVSFDRGYQQRRDVLVIDMKKKISDPEFYDFVELKLEDSGRALAGIGRLSDGNAPLHLVFVPYGWKR